MDEAGSSSGLMGAEQTMGISILKGTEAVTAEMRWGIGVPSW